MTVMQQAMICVILYFAKGILSQEMSKGNARGSVSFIYFFFFFFFPWSISLVQMKWQQNSEHWETSHSSLSRLGLSSYKSSLQVLLPVLYNQKAKVEWLLVLHSSWCQKRMCFTHIDERKKKESNAVELDRNLFTKESTNGQ